MKKEINKSKIEIPLNRHKALRIMKNNLPVQALKHNIVIMNTTA
jgi:hypothetical protein